MIRKNRGQQSESPAEPPPGNLECAGGPLGVPLNPPEEALVLRPKLSIRRFDVFAEYHRLDRLRSGMPAEEAKGYGLWLAKVVAARKFAKWKTVEDLDRLYQTEVQEKQYPPSQWRRLSGKEQTDELFDKEIIQRMGRDFYDRVFAPAIWQAYEEGRSYRDIRDTIRRDWKP